MSEPQVEKIGGAGETGAPDAAIKPLPEEKIHCTRCFAEIPNVDSFCPVCGLAWNGERKQKIVTCFRVYCIGLAVTFLHSVAQFFLHGHFLVSFAVGMLSGIVWIIAYIYTLIFLYQCWSLIPKKARRASPGQYVGFLFIPVYQLYWMFPAYYGLVKSQNALLPEKKHGNGGLVLIFLIVPYVFGGITMLVGVFASLLPLLNPDFHSVWIQQGILLNFLTAVFGVLMAVIGYFAVLQLKNGACSLLELPAEEKSRIMSSVSDAYGMKQVPLWPIWTIGGCGCLIVLLGIFIFSLMLIGLSRLENNPFAKGSEYQNTLRQLKISLGVYGAEDN